MKKILFLIQAIFFLSIMTVDASIVGFDYSPYRDGQQPYGPCPSDNQIEEDLTIMQSTPLVSNFIRTYTVTDGPCNLFRIVDIAEQVGNNIIVGAWLSGDNAHDDAEISKVIDVINTHNNVKAAIIGSETLRFNRMSKTELIAYIEQVRANVNVPVSTAEPSYEWQSNQDLADHVDFISVNLHPYWAGILADNAADWTINEYYNIRNIFPGRFVAISETGWPTEGETNGQAVPSVQNQRAFLLELYQSSQTENISFLVFEAFDENWKPGLEVEKHWGVYNSDRTIKRP